MIKGEIIGLVGMLILASSWIPQTIETIKTKQCPLNFGFILIYAIASTLLTMYSYIIGDMIFLMLNALAAFQSAVNLYIKMRYN